MFPLHLDRLFFILGFGLRVKEIIAFLGCYWAYNGCSLPTFRDELSASSSSCTDWPLKMKLIFWAEKSITKHQSTLRNIREGRNHTGRVFSLGYSFFPCQYHSTNAPYSFIHLPPTLYNVFLPVLQFPLSVSFHQCSILIHSSTTHAV